MFWEIEDKPLIRGKKLRSIANYLEFKISVYVKCVKHLMQFLLQFHQEGFDGATFKSSAQLCQILFVSLTVLLSIDRDLGINYWCFFFHLSRGSILECFSLRICIL